VVQDGDRQRTDTRIVGAVRGSRIVGGGLAVLFAAISLGTVFIDGEPIVPSVPILAGCAAVLVRAAFLGVFVSTSRVRVVSWFVSYVIVLEPDVEITAVPYAGMVARYSESRSWRMLRVSQGGWDLTFPVTLGRREPSLERARRIARAAGVPAAAGRLRAASGEHAAPKDPAR